MLAVKSRPGLEIWRCSSVADPAHVMFLPIISTHAGIQPLTPYLPQSQIRRAERSQDRGVGLGACNYSTWEVERGGSAVQGHPQLPKELKVSLGYERSCLQKLKERQNKMSHRGLTGSLHCLLVQAAQSTSYTATNMKPVGLAGLKQRQSHSQGNSHPVSWCLHY